MTGKQRRRRTGLFFAVFSLVAAVIVVVVLPLLRQRRQYQFEEMQAFVAEHEASLALDLVDGNYLLKFREPPDDARIDELVDRLSELPTGFTLIGPGEGRSFMVIAECSRLTTNGLLRLCDLDLHWVELGRATLTPQLVARFEQEENLVGLHVSGSKLDRATRAAMRNVTGPTMYVDGEFVQE